MASNENISFDINEGFNATVIEYDLDSFFIEEDDDSNMSRVVDYQTNYTAKQILQICDYYGIAKDMRLSKCNKEFVSNVLVEFETCDQNTVIVAKRRRLWMYIHELKNDKFMKKYIFW